MGVVRLAPWLPFSEGHLPLGRWVRGRDQGRSWEKDLGAGTRAGAWASRGGKPWKMIQNATTREIHRRAVNSLHILHMLD